MCPAHLGVIFSLFRGQMSETRAPFWVGPLLGGITLASVASVGNYVVEKQAPQPRAIARDFILGSILFMLIMQILPESTSKLVTAIVSFSVFGKMVGGSATASTIATASGNIIEDSSLTVSDDIEVRVGIPRF